MPPSGDPDLSAWRAEAPYRLDGVEARLLQATVTWRRPLEPGAATPGLVTVAGHVSSTVNLLWWNVHGT